MFKQLYYSVRMGLTARLIALAVAIGVNLFYFALSALTQNFGVMITAIVFSALALGYLVVANMIVTILSLQEIYSEPKGYSLLLAPVPAWKVLLGRIIPAALIDTISIAIGGVLWLVWFSVSLVDMHGVVGQFIGGWEMAFIIVAALMGYTVFLCAFCFFRAVSRSVFYRYPLRNLWGFLATLVVAGLLGSWMNALLIPFGTVFRFGFIIHVSLNFTPFVGFMFALIFLLQAGALFWAAAYLTERKINI